MRVRMSLLGFIISMNLALPAAPGGEPVRPISIDAALKVADTAIGFPQGRPDSFEVVMAKLFAMKHQDLRHEAIPGDPEDLLSKMKGKEYWLVQYRKWPIRLDSGLAVFVDAKSGEVLLVSRDR